jgi:hypothetical protein
MVAQERIKLATIQDELRDARAEKEALKAALRIVETEKEHFRTAASTPEPRSSLDGSMERALDHLAGSAPRPRPEPLRLASSSTEESAESEDTTEPESHSNSRSTSMESDSLRFATPLEGSEDEVRDMTEPSPSASEASETISPGRSDSVPSTSPHVDEEGYQSVLVHSDSISHSEDSPPSTAKP